MLKYIILTVTLKNIVYEYNTDLNMRVKSGFFLKFLDKNCYLRFGRAQVVLTARIIMNYLNYNVKRAVAVCFITHKRRAQKFFNEVQQTKFVFDVVKFLALAKYASLEKIIIGRQANSYQMK